MQTVNIELSIVMPCLNEAETLETCINKAFTFLNKNQVIGEVVISDNGSTDGSQAIAVACGARLVHAEDKGYGAALQAGIEEAFGTYIIMGDADDSYDFKNLMLYLEKLRDGYDLVMGNRFKGGIKKGAMPFLHKYLGNPVLTYIGQLFFKTPIGDFHCGLRGFSKTAYMQMELHTTGMEFASEMVVKSSLRGLRITEVPTILSPDGRTRPPHLRTWRDGWRHLRFLLMFSPNWLFLYPGIFISTLSTVFGTMLLLNPLKLGNITFDIHTSIILSFMLIVGIQLIYFHFFVKIYSVITKLTPETDRFKKMFRYFNLERGLVIGLLSFLCGLILMLNNFHTWQSMGFSDLEPVTFVRKVLFSLIPLTLGIQIMIYSFMLSIIGIKYKKV